MKSRKNKGFTLIELLVVVAIIGILATIVLVSLSTARQKARDSRRVADIRQIQLALEVLLDSGTSYPTTLAGLVPVYMTTVPQDPATQADYWYAHLPQTNPTRYHLLANLEDTSSASLRNDADCNSSVADQCPAGETSPRYYTAGVLGGFDGIETDATNECVGAATVLRCYDVHP